MAIQDIDTKCYILALFIRDDGERFLLGSGRYEFKDKQRHFAANTMQNDVVEVQGNDGFLLAGQVKRPGSQSFDGYVGDGTTSKQEVEEYRRDFFSFFRKNFFYQVIYIFPDGTAIQRKRGFLVDAPVVQELYQIYPEYHVALNFEDVNYYSYSENASGEEEFAKSATISLSAGGSSGGLVWDELGAVAEGFQWGEIVTATGTEITVQNDSEGALPITDAKMYGDTFQQTYSGKNLFDYTDTTGTVGSHITVDANGYISCSYDNTGGSSSVFENYFTNNLDLDTSTIYAIVLEVVSVSGTGSILPFSGSSNKSQMTTSTDVPFDTLNSGDIKIYTDTTKSSFSGVDEGIRTYIRFGAGQKGSITFRISVLADTSVTPQTFSYEPYVGGTASPNPDYPQEVQTVTGRQLVTVTNGSTSEEYEINLGKNLFDKSQVVAGTLQGNGIIDPNTSTYSTSGFIKVSPNTTYYKGPSNSARLKFYYADKTPISNVYNDIADAGSAQAFTTPSNAQWMRLSMLDSYIDTLQIEVGSVATSYAPYFEPIELCKIGNAQDYIYRSGGEWYLRKRCSKAILDGSESWTESSTQGTTFVRGLLGGFAALNSRCYCDQFTYRTGNHGSYEYIWIQDTTGNLYLQISDSRLSAHSLAAFKDWLAANKPAVYSILATPTDTLITNQALIEDLNRLVGAEFSAGESQLVVSASGNLVGDLEISYYGSVDFEGGGFVWEEGGPSGPTTVEVDSIENVYPIWEVKGPATNPQLSVLTTNTTLRYNGTVAAGQTLAIDMMSKTAKLNGTSVIGNVSGEWVNFVPGNNRVVYTTNNANAESSTIYWQEVVG